MVESNQKRGMYVDKEQDKFFNQLNCQRNDINGLKEQLEFLLGAVVLGLLSDLWYTLRH